jgi:Family of unknown function (DUF6152)
MKNKILFLFVLSGLLFLPGDRAYAHHSFASTYFVDQTIKIDGTLTQFLFHNPHSYVKVDAKDDKGQMQTWSIEWGSGAQLSQSNISRDTLQSGDRVIVVGNPGRNPEEHRMRMNSIVRPSDGWKWEGVVK